MIPIKKNKFSIDDNLIIIKIGLQTRMVVILIAILFTILPFFLFPLFSIRVMDGLILFKSHYLFLLLGFVLFWFLTDVKIILNANSKTITKKISSFKIYTIDFKLIEDIKPISYAGDYLRYYGIVLKKDPLGKSKIISPKYTQTKFDQKQLDEFEEKILPKIKKMINPKID